MNTIRRLLRTLAIAIALSSIVRADSLDIVLEFADVTQFTDQQMGVLLPALERAELFWELVIEGRTGSDTALVYPITVSAQATGLASASVNRTTRMGDFVVGTEGRLWVNPTQIVPSTTGLGIAPGVDVLDELMAHEIAHALGMGALWDENQLTDVGSGEYLGQHGLAAFQDEFQANSFFVPVELAGGGSSANVHWDQLFRSSPEEGNPADPLSLSPLVGIVDRRGRDQAQDLMSPAIDPDYGEPFISNTSVQAFRDLGFDVVPQFPESVCDFDQDSQCTPGDLDALNAQIRAETYSEILDVHTDGVLDEHDRSLLSEWIIDLLPADANFDDRVDFGDFLILSGNFGESGNWSEGDFDGDGLIRFEDFLELSNHFGMTTAHAPANSVPEPNFAIAGPLFVSACCLWLRRGR